jgi:nicotinamide mononucleotide transporter
MIEITGFALAIAMVICNIRQLQWGWPLAIASSALYLVVFAQAKLYGDASLQILFIALALWGWWQWRRGTEKNRLVPRSLTNPQAAWGLALWLILWLWITWILRSFTDSDAALADAFITTSSIAATLLLARKFTANWLVWLAVNVVSVILFIHKQLWLTAVLYSLLAAMSVHGWRVWRRDAALA